MALTGYSQIAPLPAFSTSATPQENFGARFMDARTGDEYVYAKAGAVALVPGTLLQASAPVGNHQDLTPAAAAVGAFSVTVTLGATAATANQYAGGKLIVTVTPGQGYEYSIVSHPAADASATLVLTIEQPIQVALTTSSRVDLVANQYSGVVIFPTTATSCPVGVAVYPIAIGESGFIQCGGVASVLADGNLGAGVSVVASNGTAGAVEALTGSQAVVGVTQSAIATTEYGPVKLSLV